MLADPGTGNPLATAATTLGKAVLLFAGIYVIGKWVLPRALEETGRARSDPELQKCSPGRAGLTMRRILGQYRLEPERLNQNQTADPKTELSPF